MCKYMWFKRDGPLENLWGGGGDEVQKKYSRKEKLNEKKINAHQLQKIKNIHAMALKRFIQGIW